MTNGQNSFNCSEESCNNPVADNYFSHESIYNLCSEEVVNMIERTCQTCGNSFSVKPFVVRKGQGKYCSRECTTNSPEWQNHNKACHKSPEWRKKISNTMKEIFKQNPERRIKISIVNMGDKNGKWKGGRKLKDARRNHKRHNKGFVLITNKNPYDEPFEYHHLHPNLPYVVPCPKRVHRMFTNIGVRHFSYVNAMLGFQFKGED